MTCQRAQITAELQTENGVAKVASSLPSFRSPKRRSNIGPGVSTSPDLIWIGSSTTNSPYDRSKQRREVMQRIALRRKREPAKRHPNSRQLPLFIHHDDVGGSRNQSTDVGNRLSPGNSDSTSTGSNDMISQPSLPRMGVAALYPSVLVKTNLDVVDLSSLASFEVGRYTGQRLMERPGSIKYFLGGSTWSYCRYIPFYYAQSALVRNATHCVLARVRCLLTPQNREWEILALASYSKTLSALQEAINSTPQHPTAQVLCATQILSLYEVSFYL